MTNQRPFNIRIFVAEGLPDGLRFVEKSNWIGQGIICPRNRYPNVKKREEFGNSGVYILVGRDGDDDRQTIYVGEAETVRSRLDSHHANKEFWTQAIVFTTKGDPLNKAQVQYLEARLIELATETKRCRLDNGNVPNLPGLSEAEEAEIAGYLDELLSLLPVIGIDAFEKLETASKRKRLYYWRGKGWKATGWETASGFAVKAGSLARGDTVPSMGSYSKMRQQLIDDGILTPDADGYRLGVDHEFSSPSGAAAVIAGRAQNGREAWKDADGVSLKEHQEQEASV